MRCVRTALRGVGLAASLAILLALPMVTGGPLGSLGTNSGPSVTQSEISGIAAVMAPAGIDPHQHRCPPYGMPVPWCEWPYIQQPIAAPDTPWPFIIGTRTLPT